MYEVGGSCRPFLKWVGGKRWLFPEHVGLLPTKYATYFEVFLGGGAVFFHLRPRRAILNDLNGRLVHCYREIRRNWNDVMTHLSWFEARHSDEFYYIARDTTYRSLAKEAAKFIYLNRTCFNGIYRENLNGIFNVPRGTKDTIIFPYDDFESVSRLLKRATLRTGDFEEVIDRAGENDFVFIDPPYTVKHDNNGFVKYNQVMFSWEDQLRLKQCVVRAADRGAMCLITNANHKSIIDLYSGIGRIMILGRASVVAGASRARGACAEIAICVGYDPAVEVLVPPRQPATARALRRAPQARCAKE